MSSGSGHMPGIIARLRLKKRGERSEVFHQISHAQFQRIGNFEDVHD